MKKTTRSLLLAALLFSSCGEDDVQPIPETCTIQEQRSHPNSPDARLLVPNAFTPNGDGLNDGLGLLTYQIATISFTVFDASGAAVFHTSQLNQPWMPGMATAVAQYTYQITATTDGGDQIGWCGSIYALPCIPPGVDPARLIFGDQFDPAAPEGYIRGSSQERFAPCE